MRARLRRVVALIVCFIFLITGLFVSALFVAGTFEVLHDRGMRPYGKTPLQAPLVLLLAILLMKGARDFWRRYKRLANGD